MSPPATRYAQRDGLSIAYQVLGDGPPDLILVPGFISHLDLQWTDPGFSRFLNRLASFSRLILFDKPGTGLSDPVPHLPTLEERIADVKAVADATGSERPVLLGFSEGGPTCVLFAATWPERTSALILYGTFARAHPNEEDLRGGPMRPETYEMVAGRLRDVVQHWGEGRLGELLAPSTKGEVQRRFWGLFERAGASPAMARALIEAGTKIDVTGVLPTVHVPTLVLHRTGDFFPVVAGRYLAERVPGARFVELPGEDHAFWLGDQDPVLGEIERFLTGAEGSAESDRVLATVLFMDIVGSTQRAAELGDARWHQLLDLHHDMVRREFQRFGGREVDAVGDGFLATFDGPGRAIKCACAISESDRELGLEVRSGLHAGECEVMGDKVGGLAVHIGARIAAQALAGEILVSSTVKDLMVGSTTRFAERGAHRLKGVPGEWRLFAVEVGGGAAAGPALAGPRDTMTATDRRIVGLARRAPRAMRSLAKLASLSRWGD